MFQWIFRYSVRVGVTSGNVSTDVFFPIKPMGPTLFFLFIIYMISLFLVTAVHAGMMFIDLSNASCFPNLTLPLVNLNAFQFSALTVWCNCFHMGSSVPNQHCRFALSSIFERTLCTQNARYLAQKHVI